MSVPPSVVRQPSPASADPSPSPSIFTRPTTPGLSIDQERSSSETQTIFTIYSMYGDDNAGSRASRSDTNLDGKRPEVPESFFLSTPYSTSDLAYYQVPSDIQPDGQILAAVDITKPASVNGFVAGNPRRSQANNSARSTLENPRASAYRPNTLNTPVTAPRLPRDSYRAGPSDSPPPSVHRPSKGIRHSSSHATGLSSPPRSTPQSRQPSPVHNGDLNTSTAVEVVSDLHPIASSAPSTPPRSRNASPDGPLLKPPASLHQQPKPKHPLTSQKILPSNSSLVPSEGEDPDAFHVRNTYAQLDVCGVKGDGYEEGVERTRARIGDSAASQMDAERALGDGTEKTQELSAKELEMLASVDRYGFFNLPTHDRLVLLPSSPFLKRLSRARAGPSNAPTSGQFLSSVPPTPVPPKESDRIAKWNRMLQASNRDVGGNVEAWSIKPSKLPKFRERVYKGIPDRWRSAAWELIVNRQTKSGKQAVEELKEVYREELDKPSSYDIQIDLDVPRTISGHVMFRTRYGAGQRSLFHVLHCFSLLCPDCGYVQGMGPIAATLLCYFSPSQVYSTLVRIHTHPFYSLHAIFSPGFPGLLEAIYVQERIIEQFMPDVFANFKKNMISTTSYATKWYITLFANTVPFQCQLRLWDVFLLEGKDVFVAVAVAIVWVYRDHLTSAEANFETILSLLSSVFVPEDEDALLMWMEKTLGDKELRHSMEVWREDWKRLVSSGKSASALL